MHGGAPPRMKMSLQLEVRDASAFGESATGMGCHAEPKRKRRLRISFFTVCLTLFSRESFMRGGALPRMKMLPIASLRGALASEAISWLEIASLRSQ